MTGNANCVENSAEGRERSFDTHKRTATVMHCNHIEMDVDPANLRCACAPCHLKYDAKHHAKNRKMKKEKVE